MDIQKDLPDMPAEVIEAWLLPIAQKEDFGWPPTEYNAWRYMLDSNSTLGYLARLKWEKDEVKLNPALIHKHDMDVIFSLFKAYVVGVSSSPSTAKPEDYNRFRGHCDDLKDNGVFSQPLILEKTREGFRVLDGFYRLCAFFYLIGYLKVENTETRITKVSAAQEAWLGSID